MVEKLKDTDFAWHEGQDAAPSWSAKEAQMFFDAPSKILMAKLNELIDEATKLKQELDVLWGNKVDDIGLWLDDENVAKKYPTIMAVVNYIQQQPFEKTSDKVSDITDALENRDSNWVYPTVGAVANYVNDLLNKLLTDVGGNIEDVRKTANDNAQAIADHGMDIEELRQVADNLLSANETAMLAIQNNASAISKNKGLIDGHTEQLQTLSADIGEIDAALDNIITLQQSFIGGDAA